MDAGNFPFIGYQKIIIILWGSNLWYLFCFLFLFYKRYSFLLLEKKVFFGFCLDQPLVFIFEFLCNFVCFPFSPTDVSGKDEDNNESVPGNAVNLEFH